MRPSVVVILRKLIISATGLLVLAGCEQQEFRMPPYIAQKGCEFRLVISGTESAEATVPRGNAGTTKKLAAGKYQIEVADCQIIDNPNGLPIYED